VAEWGGTGRFVSLEEYCKRRPALNVVVFFSNAGWESAKAFSVAILVIYRVLLYNMSFPEVPDVSCIWSVVTICCVRFHNFS